jgi:hypothetical protein
MIKKIKQIAVIAALLAMPGILLLPVPALAVDVFEKGVCRNENLRGETPTVCREKRSRQNPIYGTGGMLTILTNFLTVIVGIAAVITIILGGLKFVTSGSNPEEVKAARERVIYALIAIIIAASAQLIVRFIAESAV